ncbi:MAG: metal ABC transporter substrate-binding protein, partial [Eubacteriales bacterium]
FHYDDVEEEHDHDQEEEEHDHDHEEEEHDHDHEEEEHDHDHEEEDHDHEEEHDHDHEEDTHDHEEEETHDHEEEETHDHEEEAHDHDHDEAGHEDEHYWMSLTIAQNLCAVITDEICALDPENEDTYRSNLTAYTEKLSALDEEYQTMVDAASSNVIVVADRFPFVYLTEDYGLEYYAAFSGCSAETEASAGTIVALTERVEEFALSVVVTTETGHEIAQTIVDNASGDQDILALDSLQSTSSNSGDTYLSVMASNLDVLRDILG